MPAKRNIVDKNKLYNLVKEGKSAQEIMKALKIKQKQGLKSTLFDLSIEKNEVLTVPGLGTRSIGNRKLTKVGLSIPLAQLKDYFEIGNKFEMEINKEKITLTKIVAEE